MRARCGAASLPFARIEWTMRSEISCSCSIDLIDQSGANAARALTQRERFRPGCASSSWFLVDG